MDSEKIINYIIAIDATIITILLTIIFVISIIILLGVLSIVKNIKKTTRNITDFSDEIAGLSVLPKTIILKLSELIVSYIDDLIMEKRDKHTHKEQYNSKKSDGIIPEEDR